jgi:glycosyltransferase involved in cell wall biosynthesis
VTVSVVIAAHARPGRTRALLEALAGEAEVVVAADGATPAVHAVLEEFGVRVVRLDPGRGPAAARNAGWRAATGDVIAFTDDDCVPAPGWTAALLAAAGDGEVVVQGRVEPLPAERHLMGPFNRTLEVHAAGPFFQTANILYPRAVLERLGGFDESFTAPAGEDTDLGWRAQEAGVPIRYAPDALVWHAVHEFGWRGMVRDAPRFATALRVLSSHPGVRENLHHRIFWKPAHEKVLLAAAGIALGRRTHGAALGAVVPWLLVHRAEHASRGALLRALPAHLAVDVAEVAAMTRGSWRARTLLI